MSAHSAHVPHEQRTGICISLQHHARPTQKQSQRAEEQGVTCRRETGSFTVFGFGHHQFLVISAASASVALCSVTRFRVGLEESRGGSTGRG